MGSKGKWDLREMGFDEKCDLMGNCILWGMRFYWKWNWMKWKLKEMGFYGKWNLKGNHGDYLDLF